MWGNSSVRINHTESREFCSIGIISVYKTNNVITTDFQKESNNSTQVCTPIACCSIGHTKTLNNSFTTTYTISIPISCCSITHRINTTNNSSNKSYDICTPCVCYEVRYNSDGSKEIIVETICSESTILVPPEQVTMNDAKN